ncbi:MAG: hypothetical protein ABII90_05160, partial [Bacteroidota bacterium]
IETFSKRVIIWIFNVFFIISGLLIIKYRKEISFISYKNILLAIFSIIVSLLICEYLFRLFYHEVSPVDQLFEKHEYFHPKPYVMFGGQPHSGNLNIYGYKGNAPSKIKAKDEFRIFMLGGSTLFAGDPTICELLEQEFGKSDLSHVRCYNYGMPASTSSMELARIVYEISDLYPDLIIMYNGGNDILINLWADPRPGYPYNYFIYENNPLLVREVSSYPMLALMAYESKLLRYLFPGYFINKFTRFNEIKKQVHYGSDLWKNNIARIYVGNVVKAQKISKVFGADFIAFFQPLIYFKDSLSDEEQIINQIKGLGDHVIEMHSKVLNEFSLLKPNTDLKIIDLNYVYDKTFTRVFKDEIHTQQQYKPIVAQEIFQYLVKEYGIKKFEMIQ